MIVPYPVDDLRARVMETVYEHWEEPRAGENLGRVSGTEADRLARAALDAMLTRPFRVGVRPARRSTTSCSAGCGGRWTVAGRSRSRWATGR